MVHARKLVLHTELFGMGADIATIKIAGYAKERELKEWTDLVCPHDKKKPSYRNSYYECSCGQKYTAWQALMRVERGTTKPLDIPKLTKGGGETEKARLYQMPFSKFIKLVDSEDGKERPRFVTTEDETSTKNLFKMLVAQEMDKTAIIVKFNDTTEEKIALLTTSASGRIILRFIIPTNLLVFNEAATLVLDRTTLTEKDVVEARAFLKQIPEATKDVLEVKDYRIKQLKIIGGEKQESEKVQALGNIMARANGKKEEKPIEVAVKKSKKRKA